MRGMSWVFRVLFYFHFFILQEFKTVESFGIVLDKRGDGGSMALRCAIEKKKFCGGFDDKRLNG